MSFMVTTFVMVLMMINHDIDIDDSYRVKSSLTIIRVIIIFHDDDDDNGYDHKNEDDEDQWDIIMYNNC